MCAVLRGESLETKRLRYASTDGHPIRGLGEGWNPISDLEVRKSQLEGRAYGRVDIMKRESDPEAGRISGQVHGQRTRVIQIRRSLSLYHLHGLNYEHASRVSLLGGTADRTGDRPMCSWVPDTFSEPLQAKFNRI